MIQIDRHTIIQILGSLMSRPDILNDTDKYSFEPSDFTELFDRYVYSAIYNLYINGIETIHTTDLLNYFSNNNIVNEMIEKQNGVSFLNDCENFSDERNFDYYYNKLKKYSLIRELQKTGRDTSNIYCEDIYDDNYNEINNKFEKLTTTDIINTLKAETMDYEKRYVFNNQIEEGTPVDGIRDRLKRWKEVPEIGSALQGSIFNTICRGGRKGKVYLRSSSSGGGKSRSMVGDACHIAYPIRYDTQLQKWVFTGSCSKILYVMTEQETEEIDTMILAYLTGYNEDVFTYATFDPEDPRIQTALDIMETYKDNFFYARVPDPCSSVIKNLFRRYAIQEKVENIFYDYIFSSPAMLAEYRDLKLREDVALRYFTTTIKNLAVELDVFILTSTQLSNMDEDKGGFKDFRNIQGSRAICNLVDLACIMTKPTNEELSLVKDFQGEFGYPPNVVIDIFKNRRGRWTDVRLWSMNNLGCCRRNDLFITDKNCKPIKDFKIVEFIETANYKDFEDKLVLYNTGEVTGTTEDCYEFKVDNAEEIMENLSEAFGDTNDRLNRIKDKGLSDLL